MIYVLLFYACAFAAKADGITGGETAPVLDAANMLKQGVTNVRPVVELGSRSHMSFDRRLHRAYLSGTLFAQVNGAELTSRMPVTNIVALVEGLQKLGFFELSESEIKKRIAEVAERTGKQLAVSDYGTDNLTVRYQGRENTVSWYAIESYADRYPEVKELRKLRDCFDLANRVLIEPLRP